MKSELIRKLRLKKGCKYILIIPETTGLSGEDIANIDHAFVELGIMVRTARGMKVIEYDTEQA